MLFNFHTMYMCVWLILYALILIQADLDLAWPHNSYLIMIMLIVSKMHITTLWKNYVMTLFSNILHNKMHMRIIYFRLLHIDEDI